MRLAEFAGSARAFYFRGVWEGGLGVDWFCFKGGAFGRVFFGSVTSMGLVERLSPNATYLEIDTCLGSYPVILGVKMWSCILPAEEDWSQVRDRLNSFVWVRGIFVPYLLSSCCVQIPGG